MQHLMAGELNLFISGGGSRPRAATSQTSHTKFAKACSGFATVSLGASRMNVGMIDNEGKLLYSTNVSRNSASALSVLDRISA